MSIDEERDRASTDVESAIPGLRVMAIVRWALLVAVALLAAGTWWTYVLQDTDEVQGEDRYYCPMHPQIRSPEPGECSICHMRLEPIPEGSGPAGEAHEHEHDAEAEATDTAPVAVMLTTERRQTSGIATAPARRESVSDGARWPAVVEAREGARAEVRVRTNAYVERLVVREPGVVVRAGQVLAWIYSPEIVRAAEELRSARAWPPIPGTEETAARTGHTMDAAARERLVLLGVAPGDIARLLEGERAPRTVPLRAPVSGHVTRLETAIGAYATPDALLFEIVDLSRVRAVASVFADELALAAPGAAARFVPRDGGEAVPLELELIEPDVEGDARTARVRFLARNPTLAPSAGGLARFGPGRERALRARTAGTEAGEPILRLALRPGQIGDVVLEGTATEHLVVPRDAVIDTGTRRYVFVARAGGLFEPRAVELGPLRGEQRVIASGLEPGELVVVRGGFVLDSESRLQSALAPDQAQPPVHPDPQPEEAPR